MSGICSNHIHYHKNCAACNADIYDILPEYESMIAEADNVGQVKCEHCNFVFYRTIEFCPKCSHWTWLDGGYEITWKNEIFSKKT